MLAKLNEMHDAWGFHAHGKNGKKLINPLDNLVKFL